MRSAASSAGRLSAPSPLTEPPRSLTTTLAPCVANSSASPRPTPWPPPVTIATLPSSNPIASLRSRTDAGVTVRCGRSERLKGEPSGCRHQRHRAGDRLVTRRHRAWPGLELRLGGDGPEPDLPRPGGRQGGRFRRHPGAADVRLLDAPL